MTAIRPFAAVALAAAVWSTAVLADTKPPALTAAWRTTPVAVDGRADDWANLTPVESAQLAVAVANDDRTLSVAVTSSDQARRRQLTAAGLLVWFDTGGGKKRQFGVRFPGLLGGGRPAPDREPPDRRPADSNAASREAPRELRLPPLTWFELAGPREEDRRRLERSAVTSMAVAREFHEGLLVFELSLPLARDAAGYGLGADPGRVVGLGLETPEVERPEGPAPSADRGGRGMGGGGGGFGGAGGGMGMGRGGMGGRGRGPGDAPGDRPARAKPFKAWTTVQLAAMR